jgi:hypothetical protein
MKKLNIGVLRQTHISPRYTKTVFNMADVTFTRAFEILSSRLHEEGAPYVKENNQFLHVSFHVRAPASPTKSLCWAHITENEYIAHDGRSDSRILYSCEIHFWNDGIRMEFRESNNTRGVYREIAEWWLRTHIRNQTGTFDNNFSRNDSSNNFSRNDSSCCSSNNFAIIENCDGTYIPPYISEAEAEAEAEDDDEPNYDTIQSYRARMAVIRRG